MTVHVTDKVEIDGTKLRADGYLVVDARVARTGIQRYAGSEVGRPDLQWVDVYRPEEEVFDADAMASFAHRPVTDDHPAGLVNSNNYKDLAVGHTSDAVGRDGEYLRVPLMVADGDTISKVQDGKRELSAGYLCDLDWGEGTTPKGEHYDARQTKIRANHVAIVQAGRAGKHCRIGDGASAIWGDGPPASEEAAMSDQLKSVMVDGLSVSVTDQGAQAIAKLIDERDQARDALAEAQDGYGKKMKEKDDELEKKDAQCDALQAKILDQAAIDQLVADRVALISTAQTIHRDLDPKGMSDADVRRAVVKHALGDKIPAEKLASDAYVEAHFDILADEAGKSGKDPFRAAAKDGLKPVASVHDARQQAFNDMQYFDQHGQERKVS